MITVSNVSFQFGGQLLFKDVDLKFTPGNCYGIIGANGAGKSTFLRILCGELQPTRGEVSIPKTVRMSVLKQDHFAYESFTVLDTVIMGNARLYEIMKQKDELYMTIKREDICGSLGDVINSTVSGRENDDEIIVFESVGVAAQDLVAAKVIYDKAVSEGIGLKWE